MYQLEGRPPYSAGIICYAKDLVGIDRGGKVLVRKDLVGKRPGWKRLGRKRPNGEKTWVEKTWMGKTCEENT